MRSRWSRRESSRRFALRFTLLLFGFLAGEARLKRLHQVEHLGVGAGRDISRDVLSIDLALDGLQHALAHRVLVLGGLERLVRCLIDQLDRKSTRLNSSHT